MSDVATNFIKPMVALYGEIDSDDTGLVLGVYRKTLSGYLDEDLKAGFQTVADTYIPSKRSPWPKPAICRKACEEAAQKRLKSAPPSKGRVSFDPVRRAPPDEVTQRRWDEAAAWREQVVAKYGSVDAFLLQARWSE